MNQKPTTEFVTEKDITLIHDESLRVLEEVGLKIDSKKAMKTLSDHGAKVDTRNNIVKFPEKLINWAVDNVPKKIIYGASNPELDLVVDASSEKVVSRNISGCEGYIDINSGKWGKVTEDNLIESIRLVDALDNIHYCGGIYPQDLTVSSRDVLIVERMLEYTEKHIHIQPYSKRSVEQIVNLITSVVSKDELKERPLISFLNSALSPLRYQESEIEVLYAAAENGIPVELNSMPLAGATGPVTICGNITQSNAELLGGIALIQTAYTGAPILYAPRGMILNMTTGMGLSHTIECAIQAAIQAQLVRKKYGIIVNVVGMGTDSLIPDGQSIFERTISTLFPLLAGANIIGVAGHMEHYYTFSPVQLVIDNEIYGMLFKHLLNFYPVDKDRIGFNAIKDIMHGGDYLGHNHTLDYFRTEYYNSDLFENRARAVWENDGKKDLVTRAKEKALKILKNHEVPLLSPKIIRELRDKLNGIE